VIRLAEPATRVGKVTREPEVLKRRKLFHKCVWDDWDSSAEGNINIESATQRPA